MRTVDPALGAMTRAQVTEAIGRRMLTGAQVQDWFLSEPVLHHLAGPVLEQLVDCDRGGADEPIRLLIGPGGVGKSTMMQIAHHRINFAHRDAMLADPLLLASILVEVATPDGKELTAESFYEPLLQAVGAPPVSGCLPPARPGLPQVWLPRRVQVTEPLAARVIRLVTPRHPKVIFLDESKNIMWQRDPEEVERHLNRLKTIANSINAFFVLGMAYDGLKLWDPDAQLIRRLSPIHFRRYGSSPDDQAHFGEALTALIGRLPLPAAFALNLDYLYGNTVGCIGLLADWLGKALKAAVAEGATMVTGDHLRAEVMPFPMVVDLLGDAHAGESHAWMQSGVPTVGQWEAHRAALGFGPPDEIDAEDGEPAPATAPIPASGDDSAAPGAAAAAGDRKARADRRARRLRTRRRRTRLRDADGQAIEGTTEVASIHVLRDFEPAPRRHRVGMHPADADAARTS